MTVTAISTATAFTLPVSGWTGSVLDAARWGDPATQGAALARIDEVTGSREATAALLADPDRRYLKITNEQADSDLSTSANHRTLVGHDSAGDPVWRWLDDADIWGPAANNAGHSNMGPLANISQAEETNRWIAQDRQFHAQQAALDKFARAQALAAANSAQISFSDPAATTSLDQEPAFDPAAIIVTGTREPKATLSWHLPPSLQPLGPLTDGILLTPTEPEPVPEDEIVVTASTEPRTDAEIAAAAARLAALDAATTALDARSPSLPVFPVTPATNPYHLGLIDHMEAEYLGSWNAANRDGVVFDLATHFERLQGFEAWRTETRAANAAATDAQFDILRNVLPPLDFAISASAIRQGEAGIVDYVTVGAAIVPGTGKMASTALDGADEIIQLSKSRFGHTFTSHGQDATEFLTRRAEGSGMPQGQFLDDQAAARFIQDNLDKFENGAVSIPIPHGLPARIVMPDGSFSPPNTIRLVPGGNGVKTAYPEP